MTRDPIFVLAVLGLCTVLSEWLVRRTFCRHLGTALLVIVITAIVANLGVIPAGGDPIPLYDGIFGVVAPLSIFLLLLAVNLRDVLRAGPVMLLLFAVGSVGTMVGVVAGMAAVGGDEAFGELYAALGGMFAATYIGGSLNFNLLALHYGVNEQAAFYAGAVAVDSIMTTIWMVLSIVLPRWVGGRRKGSVLATVDAADAADVADVGDGVDDVAAAARPGGEVLDGIEEDSDTLHPLDLALLLALSAGALWLSRAAVTWLAADGGPAIPDVLVLTTLALILAQLPGFSRLRGARTLGMLGVYLFLAVIGAYCDLAALSEVGRLGPILFLFASVLIVVHGAIVFGFARLFRLDPDTAAVASQANIGGGTSALALARSLGRGDLVLPAILVGSLGTALGTYLGFLTVGWLGGVTP